MNLTDVSFFDVLRLSAAAGLGWGLASGLWGAVSGAIAASMAAYTRRHMPVIRVVAANDDDTTPPAA